MAAKTIADMKVGDPLDFGRYSVLVDNMNPEKIRWVKMTQNSDFITKGIVDMLVFDASEADNSPFRYYGNPDFDCSNIKQYLNSELGPNEWYVQQSEIDRPPTMASPWLFQSGYIAHSGFLHFFDEGEIEAIEGVVRLPYRGEIFSGDEGRQQAPYFKRHAIRAHGSGDFIRNKENCPFEGDSWIEYFLMDTRPGTSYSRYLSRSGIVRDICASTACGIRPVCNIREDVKVEYNKESGAYEVLPSSPAAYQQQDINKLFGI